jgi:hypothetical protein
MIRPLRRMAMAAAVVSAASLLVSLSPAHADSGVTIVKIPNQVHEYGSFPVTLRPLYTKFGSTVVDSAVLTVRDNTTGALIGAGRTHIEMDPGEYKITTTVRYRTFTTVGYVKKTVAKTGDIIPTFDYSTNVPQLFVSRCFPTSHTMTQDVEEPFNRHGTYTARCSVRWGGGGDVRSSETGYATIKGVFLGEFYAPRGVYRYQYQLGDTYVEGAPTGAGLNEFVYFDPLPVPASHDITHVFPIRKYSSQKVAQATHIVRLKQGSP